MRVVPLVLIFCGVAGTGLAGAQEPLTDKPRPSIGIIETVEVRPERPAVLVPLYGSMITLQTLDLLSTWKALDNGSGVEANPLMAPIAGNRVAFTLVKASGTAAMILLTEKLWKKHRKAAIVVSIVTNVSVAAVVAHNFRVARR